MMSRCDVSDPEGRREVRAWARCLLSGLQSEGAQLY